jgi:hypothetical protein
MTRLINYTPASNIAYRHNLGELRQVLDTVHDWFTKSPGAKVDVVSTIKTFAVATSINLNNIAANQTLLTNGDNIPLLTAAGGAIGANATASISATVFAGGLVPATIGLLVNGGVATVKNSAGTTVDASAAVAVAANIVTGISLAATKAVITNGDAAVPLGDATANANGQTTGTATVASGVVTRINTGSGVKIMKTTQVYACPAPTGTWVSQIALTISAAGAITAVTLS